LICGVVVRLLQRVGWLRGKICRGGFSILEILKSGTLNVK